MEFKVDSKASIQIKKFGNCTRKLKKSATKLSTERLVLLNFYKLVSNILWSTVWKKTIYFLTPTKSLAIYILCIF